MKTAVSLILFTAAFVVSCSIVAAIGAISPALAAVATVVCAIAMWSLFHPPAGSVAGGFFRSTNPEEKKTMNQIANDFDDAYNALQMPFPMARLPALVERLATAALRLRECCESVLEESSEKESMIAEMQLEIEALEQDNLRLGKELQNLQDVAIPPCFAIKAFEQQLKESRAVAKRWPHVAILQAKGA